MKDNADIISWEYDIPLLTNRYMLWDLTRLYTATIAITGLIILVATGFDFRSVTALSMFGAPILAGLLVLSCLLLGNRIRVKYVLDVDGAGGKVSRRMSKLNKVTVVLGALAGSPGVTGAGLLASSGEQVFVPWDSVVRASFDRGCHVVTLHNEWRSVLRLFCYEDNFDSVLDFVNSRLPGKVHAGGIGSVQVS